MGEWLTLRASSNRSGNLSSADRRLPKLTYEPCKPGNDAEADDDLGDDEEGGGDGVTISLSIAMIIIFVIFLQDEINFPSSHCGVHPVWSVPARVAACQQVGQNSHSW